jgi:hypothetical protein
MEGDDLGGNDANISHVLSSDHLRVPETEKIIKYISSRDSLGQRSFRLYTADLMKVSEGDLKDEPSSWQK